MHIYMHDSRYLIFVHHQDEPAQGNYLDLSQISL